MAKKLQYHLYILFASSSTAYKNAANESKEIKIHTP